jgi:hypothetical protein
MLELSGASGVKRLRTTSTAKLDLLDIEREGREDGWNDDAYHCPDTIGPRSLLNVEESTVCASNPDWDSHRQRLLRVSSPP